MDKSILKNTILDIYPLYTRKEILKQAVDVGYIIDYKKKINGQYSLQSILDDTSIDVSGDTLVDEKCRHMLDSEKVLAVFEEYDYKKPYRHFCYFKYSSMDIEKIEELVKNGQVNVFDEKSRKIIDDFEKPTIYFEKNLIYLKFSYELQNDVGNRIKYVMLAIIDREKQILEIRFDRIGIAYRNSDVFYKNKIAKILNYLEQNVKIYIQKIDFKAVVDYIKSEKMDITFLAQRLTRNGTTAHLEIEDEANTIPILGELESFIQNQKDLFDIDNNTREIRNRLQDLISEIEIKSDMPFVKILMNKTGIKLGITHNYKGTEYSLFMLYGELLGEEMMGSVKEYVIQCYEDLRAATSVDAISAEEV